MGKATLKHILQKFLAHVEEKERQRKSDNDVYQREFQSLKELTEALKCDLKYSSSEGLKDVNRRKNRYKDILPYNLTRVTISEYPGVPGSDYINANYVKGSTGSTCAYIASQGPLPNTVVDYWRMIWECEVTLIIMACNERESGKYKCEVYWPQTSDEEHQYGNITVKLVKWRQVCPDFLVRTLRISQDSAERTVCQFHYTTWPDHGVPPHVQPILELVRLMRDVQPTEARPILVHCSAGCGRTGTICSIDYVWALLRTGKLDEDFCLYDILVDMRKQRIAMVQTYEQYVLCYHAVAALFEQQLKIIDAHTYENLDEDGHPLLFRSINDCARNSSSSEPESCDELDGIETFPSPNEQSKISLTDDCKAMACARTSPAPESSKQEKLVGKATVIRRPSIAKLKAMFENVNIVEQPSERPLLQRSHSTRERSTTGMHPARVVRTNDLALVRQQHAAVVNEVQALCSTVEREQTPSDQNTEESDPVNNIAFDAELPIYGTNVDLEPQPIYAYRPPMRVATNVPTVSMKEIFHPPPKPPRTYQYHIIAPNGSRAQSNTVGRIIYTIAPPQPNYTTVDDSRIAMQRQYHQRHASTPNIAAAVLTMPMNNLPADMRKTLEYEDVKKMRAAQAASSHAINREPIYQPIARNHPMRVEPIYQTMSMPKDAMLNPYSVPQYIAQAERRKLGGDKVVPIQRKDIQVIQRPLSSYEGVYDIPKNYSLGDMSRQDPQNYAKYVTVPHNAKQARNVRPPEHSKVNVKVEESALQSETRTSNDKAATSKSDAKKLKGKETKSHMEPKKNSSFSLPFFGKSKSKQKSKTEKQQQANSPAPKPNSSNAAKANTVAVRPPHSHRFSPPTQWTQV